MALLKALTKRAGRPVILILFATVVVGGCLIAVRHNAMRHLNIYYSLKPSMSEEDVSKSFGRNPDYECRFHNTKILYFFRPNLFGRSVKNKLNPNPAVVSEKNQIPYQYDAIQVLIGPDLRVRAFTWNGETATICTESGSVPGSNVAELPDSFFE